MKTHRRRSCTCFLFLAVVLDEFSRRVVASAATRISKLDSSSMRSIWRFRGETLPMLCIIPIRERSTHRLLLPSGREAGVRHSMGSVGVCYDNAMCESFNATLECERAA